MNLDENKIKELIRNEIKQQVTNKVKQIGRETIKTIYKEVIGEQVRDFLLKQEIDLMKELKNEISYDRDSWKQNVAEMLTDRLLSRMNQTFFDDDYDWE